MIFIENSEKLILINNIIGVFCIFLSNTAEEEMNELETVKHSTDRICYLWRRSLNDHSKGTSEHMDILHPYRLMTVPFDDEEVLAHINGWVHGLNGPTLHHLYD